MQLVFGKVLHFYRSVEQCRHGKWSSRSTLKFEKGFKEIKDIIYNDVLENIF